MKFQYIQTIDISSIHLYSFLRAEILKVDQRNLYFDILDFVVKGVDCKKCYL